MHETTIFAHNQKNMAVKSAGAKAKAKAKPTRSAGPKPKLLAGGRYRSRAVLG